MPRAPYQTLLGVALAAAVALPGCGSERQASDPSGRGPEFYATALESVEKTPDLVRQELLRTCDKWRHLDHPCDDEQVRRAQLECWVDKGERTFQWVEGRPMRPRPRAQRVLLDVNVCMELKRYRKLVPGTELDYGK